MRLQLTIAAAATAASSLAFAQSAEIDARGGIYEDTDATTIITVAGAAKVAPIEHLSVSGGYLVDIVSSASVDVVSAATGRWEEVRNEGHVGLGLADDEGSVGASYIYSVENDWRSHTGSLQLSRDVLDHAATLGAMVAVTHNQVGRADDDNFARELLQVSGSLECSLVLSPSDLLSLTYSLQVLSGYQASPYRFVRFEGPLEGATLSAPEAHPDLRVRHALAARWNHYLWRDAVLRSSLRGYADDWGVESVTGGLELSVGIARVLEIAPFVRGYLQSSASFYREAYEERLLNMTADRELSSFVDGFGGLRIGVHGSDVGPFGELRADVKATAFAFRFFDYPLLEQRLGLLGELGVGASF
jgi:hypothetical protein